MFDERLTSPALRASPLSVSPLARFHSVGHQGTQLNSANLQKFEFEIFIYLLSDREREKVWRLQKRIPMVVIIQKKYSLLKQMKSGIWNC